MSTGHLLGLGGIVVLVLVAGFLGAADAALTHLGRAKALARRAADPTRSEAALTRVLAAPERALNAVLLLRTACLLVAATAVGVELGNRWGPLGVVLGVVAEVVVVFVLAEAIPRTYALQQTERVAVAVAPVVDLLARIPPVRWATRGLVGLTNAVLPGSGRKAGPVVSEEELLAMAGVAAENEAIANEEVRLITSVIEFGDTVAREIMVPRPDMVTVPGTATVSEALDLLIEHGYSRVPVVGDGLDDVLGVAYAKDLIRAERQGLTGHPVVSLARAARFVPETKPVATLMRKMQDEKFHMVLLVDEYGGIAGLVTLEDLIEELVGDIVDEFDVEGDEVVREPDGALRVAAGLGVHDLNALLGTALPDEDWDSVGGLVVGQLGRVPEVGEAVELDGYRFEAAAVDGHRVSLVRVSALSVPGGDDAGTATEDHDADVAP